jgi:hypothetical protein
MTYKLTVDQPHLGDAGTVYIHGLGTFTNGKSYEISDDLEQNFRVVNSVDNGEPYQAKMEFGKPLSEVAESMYGITVEEIAPSSASNSNTPSAPENSNSTPDTSGGDQ